MSIVLRMLARRVFLLGLAVMALFVVLSSFAGPSRAEQLVASWYGVGDGFAGKTTANGETFDPYAYTAAHKTLPFDTRLQVTYGGESVVVRINDRGPYIQGRDLDLSYAAARDIGLVSVGSAPVEVEYVDAATPLGPVQGSSASPAPEPETESDPAPEPAPAPEPESESQMSNPQMSNPQVSNPQVSAEAAPEESADLDQYPVDQQATDDQYVDAEQYENVAEDQYGLSGSGAPAGEPSGSAPAAEVDTENVEAEARVEDAPEQPSPATVAPPVEKLEEPPEELVDPGSTVEHRVELKIAAAPGTATESPETPAPAPADTQAEDVLVSGEPAGTPDESEAQEQESAEQESPEQESAEPTEEPLPGEGEATQEVDIEVLPDTGGPAILSGVSLVDLAGVLLAAVLLRLGLRRLRA